MDLYGNIPFLTQKNSRNSSQMLSVFKSYLQKPLEIQLGVQQTGIKATVKYLSPLIQSDFHLNYLFGLWSSEASKVLLQQAGIRERFNRCKPWALLLLLTTSRSEQNLVLFSSWSHSSVSDPNLQSSPESRSCAPTLSSLLHPHNSQCNLATHIYIAMLCILISY